MSIAFGSAGAHVRRLLRTESEHAVVKADLFYSGVSRVVFFKKKTEEAELKASTPFEVEPKPMSAPTPNQSAGGSATEGFAARVAGVAGGAQPAPTGEVGFDRYGKLRSALGPGTVIQGKLSFDTPVRIDGKLSGEIYSSEAIIVGAGGSIEGDIEVASLIVLGLVRGKVTAHQRVEVLNGGRLEADFVAPVFQMEDGGLFNGRCSMPQAGKGISKNGSGLALEVSKSAPDGKPVTSGVKSQPAPHAAPR